jgi:hypothetical protein
LTVNKKYFSIAEFKALMLELLTASSVHDGIKLQNLESKIIDTYKATTMTQRQYTTLLNTHMILLEDWRVNYK